MTPLASGSSIQSILERLDADQLFGLLCTSVAIGSALTVLVVWSVTGAIRRIWQTKLRTQFVVGLSERGFNKDEILEISRLTFQQPEPGRRARRKARREDRMLAKAARREARRCKSRIAKNMLVEKPIVQKPIPPQAVVKA